MKRRILYLFVAVLAVGIFGFGITFADNSSKLGELNNQINSLQKELNKGKVQEKELGKELVNLNSMIGEIESEISDLTGDISAAETKIQDAQVKLDETQKEMDAQSELMGQRIRAIYKNGEMGMLEILLGSENLTDLMTNIDMSQKIFNSDLQVLEKMEADYKEIERQKQELASMKQRLQTQKTALDQKKNELASSQKEVAALKSQVASENRELEAEIDAVNREANAIKAEILRSQSKDTVYTGGAMLWPCPASTRITSQFGYRLHPVLKVNKLHTGIDIGVASGNRVIAANSGTVIKAGWNNSYGYMVMIDHGGGIVTLYAHNSSLAVSTGQTVSAGQTIAYSGSTGMSTGPHLHFEVRVNGEYVNPLNYV